MSDHLYHLVPAAHWAECKHEGKPYYPATYSQDGFTHLTKDPTCLLPVANHFYKDIAGEYLVLQLQESALKHEVRYEAAAPVGDKASKNFSNDSSADVQTFPHLYGAINSDAVTAELSVARSADGTFEGIEGI